MSVNHDRAYPEKYPGSARGLRGKRAIPSPAASSGPADSTLPAGAAIGRRARPTGRTASPARAAAGSRATPSVAGVDGPVSSGGSSTTGPARPGPGRERPAVSVGPWRSAVCWSPEARAGWAGRSPPPSFEPAGGWSYRSGKARRRTRRGPARSGSPRTCSNRPGRPGRSSWPPPTGRAAARGGQPRRRVRQRRAGARDAGRGVRADAHGQPAPDLPGHPGGAAAPGRGRRRRGGLRLGPGGGGARSPAPPATSPPRPRCWPSPTRSRWSTGPAGCGATRCCRA